MDRRRFLARAAQGAGGLAALLAVPGWSGASSPAGASLRPVGRRRGAHGDATWRTAEAGACPTDAVRELLADRLAKRGVTVATPGGGTARLDVARIGGIDATDGFYLVGRVLVPITELDAVLRSLGSSAETAETDRALGLAEVVLRSGVPVIGTVERLRKQGFGATPHHLLFSAPGVIVRVREGIDPEPADRPVGPEAEAAGIGKGVRVNVVDTGIAKALLTDGWLLGARRGRDDIDLLRTYERALGTSFLDCAAGHGTLVAGIARQVAPGCDLGIIRALDTDGVVTERQAGKCLKRALSLADEVPTVVNCSFGGYTYGDRAPLGLAQVVSRLPRRAVIVAAAGNECWDRRLWPAAFRRVVSVAALDGEGRVDRAFPFVARPRSAVPAPYTNTGSWVDVAAPGTWTSTFCSGLENPVIETDGSPDRFKGYATAGGTSFATACVSGAIAAVASEKGGDVSLAAQEVVAALNQW